MNTRNLRLLSFFNGIYFHYFLLIVYYLFLFIILPFLIFKMSMQGIRDNYDNLSNFEQTVF